MERWKEFWKESEKVCEIVEREGYLIRYGVLCFLFFVGRGILYFIGLVLVLVVG